MPHRRMNRSSQASQAWMSTAPAVEKRAWRLPKRSRQRNARWNPCEPSPGCNARQRCILNAGSEASFEEMSSMGPKKYRSATRQQPPIRPSLTVDPCLTFRVVFRPSSSPEHLSHLHHGEWATHAVIPTLEVPDKDPSRWKVHTSSKRWRRCEGDQEA